LTSKSPHAGRAWSGRALTNCERKLRKTFFRHIARILLVVWPLIWTANAFAGGCETFADGNHEAAGRSVVSGHGDHGEGHHGTDEHGKNPSDDEEADSCCCVKLTAESAAVGHNASPPSESRSKVQPGPALEDGLSPPFPALHLARAGSRAPPRSRTPLFLLHLRLLN
jgi:hypothetical protein